MTTTIETWMPEAREMAAQCWCDEETKHIEMDVVLAEAIARRIAAWMETGAFHARNEAYWRDRALKAEEQVERAIPAMRAYAAMNPLHNSPWKWQDPNGVHAWLSRNGVLQEADNG